MSMHKKPKVAIEPQIMELVPRPVFLPDEDPLAYDALHDALMRELAPGTPYETVLATNLVLLDWDAIRIRRLRDNLILASFIPDAAKFFSTSTNSYVMVRALSYRSDAVNRQKAKEELGRRGINISELMARSFEQSYAVVSSLDDRLAEMELRKRRLREEFDRLKTLRKRQHEQPVIVNT